MESIYNTLLPEIHVFRRVTLGYSGTKKNLFTLVIPAYMYPGIKYPVRVHIPGYNIPRTYIQIIQAGSD